jgi:hypothetical protein
VRGECSPNYTKRHLFDRVPERIASVCPDVKLIYLVRDPVERTLSHYHGSCLQGREDRTLDAAVAGGKQSNYVRTSCYHWQLHPYLNRFSAEDLLVLSTERLGAAPEATLRTVYRFLGVDPEVQSSRAGQRFNASSEKKRQDPWVRWLSEQVPQPLKDSLRPYLPLHWLPGERVPRPTPAPEVRAHLEGILHPEAESLRALTGRDFEEWSV